MFNPWFEATAAFISELRNWKKYTLYILYFFFYHGHAPGRDTQMDSHSQEPNHVEEPVSSRSSFDYTFICELGDTSGRIWTRNIYTIPTWYSPYPNSASDNQHTNSSGIYRAKNCMYNDLIVFIWLSLVVGNILLKANPKGSKHSYLKTQTAALTLSLLFSSTLQVAIKIFLSVLP